MAAKKVLQWELFVVSVDFDTISRRAPYYQLKKLLPTLGGVLHPTHQINLLLTPLSAKRIRNKIKQVLLNPNDRVYVGKIATGSAWYNLHKLSSNAQLKGILKVWANGATPSRSDLQAARSAIKGLIP